jgi:Holliday junction resolvase-like predicted endonuclease
MQVSSEVIISLLKLSKCKPVLTEIVKNDARVPSAALEELLQSLQRDGLLYVHDELVEINTLQRLQLAVRALELGADYERVSGVLEWKEFESIAAFAFEAHGYSVKKNLRFRQGGRRWEIDILACRRPLVVCADCKHWRHGSYSSKLKKAVEEQVRRTMAFYTSLPNPAVKVDCSLWNAARFIPLVLSLTSTNLKFHEGTPVVAILQLRDFLGQLPMRMDSVRHFEMARARFKPVP